MAILRPPLFNVCSSSVYRSRKPRIRPNGSVTLTTWHHVSEKVDNSFADDWRSLGRCGTLTDSGRIGEGTGSSLNSDNIPTFVSRSLEIRIQIPNIMPLHQLRFEHGASRKRSRNARSYCSTGS
jgi:hypothetical protein